MAVGHRRSSSSQEDTSQGGGRRPTVTLRSSECSSAACRQPANGTDPELLPYCEIVIDIVTLTGTG